MLSVRFLIQKKQGRGRETSNSHSKMKTIFYIAIFDIANNKSHIEDFAIKSQIINSILEILFIFDIVAKI